MDMTEEKNPLNGMITKNNLELKTTTNEWRMHKKTDRRPTCREEYQYMKDDLKQNTMEESEKNKRKLEE